MQFKITTVKVSEQPVNNMFVFLHVDTKAMFSFTTTIRVKVEVTSSPHGGGSLRPNRKFRKWEEAIDCVQSKQTYLGPHISETLHIPVRFHFAVRTTV